jgi:hypothetical protein
MLLAIAPSRVISSFPLPVTRPTNRMSAMLHSTVSKSGASGGYTHRVFSAGANPMTSSSTWNVMTLPSCVAVIVRDRS